MSDLFNNARKLQIVKRSDRLIESTRKAKTDAQKNSYGSYQGKDPNDGTDIVKAGNNEAVSGFKLTSDSPVGTGDRVNLKKNNDGGLQRADTKNRKKAEEEEDQGQILFGRSMLISFTADVTFSGGGTVVLANSFLTGGSAQIFSLVKPDLYTFRNRRLTLSKQTNNDSFFIVPNPVLFTSIPPTCTIEVNTARTYEGSQWVDTASIVIDGWDSFTITSITAVPNIYPFTYAIAGGIYRLVDNTTVARQSTDIYKKLGKRNYSAQIFRNGSSIGSGSSSVDWTKAAEISATNGMDLLGISVPSYPISGLNFGSVYWTSTPPI